MSPCLPPPGHHVSGQQGLHLHCPWRPDVPSTFRRSKHWLTWLHVARGAARLGHPDVERPRGNTGSLSAVWRYTPRVWLKPRSNHKSCVSAREHPELADGLWGCTQGLGQPLSGRGPVAAALAPCTGPPHPARGVGDARKPSSQGGSRARTPGLALTRPDDFRPARRAGGGGVTVRPRHRPVEPDGALQPREPEDLRSQGTWRLEGTRHYKVLSELLFFS